MILDRLAKPWYVWRPWQLARRLQRASVAASGTQRKMKTAWGVAIMADPHTTIGWSIDTTGVHDLAVTEALARLIRPGDTVLDVGAHIGYTVMLAAIAAGCRGRVIAWEPHPELFRALEHNVAAMSADHRAAAVDLRNTALGSKAGKAKLSHVLRRIQPTIRRHVWSRKAPSQTGCSVSVSKPSTMCSDYQPSNQLRLGSA